ncbi:uncharacterized protein LOC129592862 isoform X2 [Paramacrobiotus metropolitanus]|uniref:uncharacterized protein LOC129592862 isoform X2 n=1 Tax=Paramacrobiotus metropolitanus TaxID=2943436 RepID=UPI002445F2FD|nr:uncharacterized protein LOC129592862 isoform X2 [Paramacrobiotus metropolitanus]
MNVSWDRVHNATENMYSEKQMDKVNYACAWVYVGLLILCTVGNGLNLAVLLRSIHTWRASACHYMITIAITDLGALWLALPFFLHMLSQGRVEYAPSIEFGIVPWLDDVSMWLSDWVLVAFSWERLLVIISPFRFQWLQRVSVARINILILLVLSLAMNMFNFVVNYEGPHYHLIGARYGADATSGESMKWFRQWHVLHEKAKIIVRLMTFLLILIPSCTLILFLAVHRRSLVAKMRVAQTAGNNERKTKAGINMNSAASQKTFNIILLSSAILYLITRAPNTFQMCAVAGNSSIGLYNLDTSVTNMADNFINLMMLVGYAMTFYVYLLIERQYRHRFMALVVRPILSCCKLTLHNRKDNHVQGANSTITNSTMVV